MLILEKITASMVFDTDKQNTVKAIFMKQFMASAYLFSPQLHLLGMNIDLGTGLNILDAALEQLQKLRSDAQKITKTVEENFVGIEWEEKWQHDIFYRC